MPRSFFYILAIVLPTGCIGNFVSAIDRLHGGWLGYFHSNNQWYESMAYAAMDGSLAWCLFSSELKRRRRERDRIASTPVHWKDRIEVRVAINVFAIMLLLAVPFAVIDAVFRVRSDPFRSTTFWHEFEFSSFIAWGIAAALIGYDRRRVRQDLRTFGNTMCIKCGYDLFATPERCPECGTIVAVLPSATGALSPDPTTAQ